jgi:transposase
MPKPQSDQPDNQVIAPAPKKAKIVRRDHSPEYKLAIIRQADSCAYGEIGALLRREKLYSSQLTDWRREFANNGVKGLSKSSPGPQASTSAEQRRIEQLEKQVARLQNKLEIADDCLELQKKALSMLERLKDGSDV